MIGVSYFIPPAVGSPYIGPRSHCCRTMLGRSQHCVDAQQTLVTQRTIRAATLPMKITADSIISPNPIRPI